MDWQGIIDFNQQGDELHSPEALPHYELLEHKTSIDPNDIYTTLIAQRLTVDDAHIEVGQYCIPLSDLIYKAPLERKRPKKGVTCTVPETENFLLEESNDKISASSVNAAIDVLNPRAEPSCEGKMVVKGRVISVVKMLNDLLLASAEKDMASPFDSSSLRHSTIAAWLNWTFKSCYGINSSYSSEQVRQMLKKNISSGRFATPLLAAT